MIKIKENEKLLKKNNFFDNLVLNKLNLDLIRNESQKINKKYRNSQLFFSTKNIKNEKIINNLTGKEIKEYNTNTLSSKDRDKIKYKSHNNLFSKNKKRKHTIMFKKYLFGNDVVLPIKSVNDCENSNIPYLIFNNKDKINSLSPIKKTKSKCHIINSLISEKYNNSNTNYKSSKILNNMRLKNFRKKLFFDKKKYLAMSSNNKINIGPNLFDSIEENKKLKNIYYKTIQNKKNKKEKLFKFRNSNSNFNNINLINHTFKSKKNNKTKKKNIVETEKNKDLDKIVKIKFDKIKDLIDNPQSFLYLMFNKMKNSKFEYLENNNKLYFKKKFSEYKKDLDKLEQNARYELFNLKKQRTVGNEINLNGRVISSNTFFDLAFGLK